MTPKPEIVVAPGLAPPAGFSHAVVAPPGKTIYIGGQTAQAPDGTIQGATMVEQFDLAARNLLVALGAAGGEPDDLVSLQVFVTNLAAYRLAMPALGTVWRQHFGRRYPAMALIGVTELLDPRALVELVGVAVLG
ncbi:MAG TPA: RidA family protein [Candidatus Saccharimonadales bacterium]|jgi:enamine deaminase RidA (YjgF/YER057c/UK114 family)|nr:RidA family protein [Candidatus Saccharimonadales bacterium]